MLLFPRDARLPITDLRIFVKEVVARGLELDIDKVGCARRKVVVSAIWFISKMKRTLN